MQDEERKAEMRKIAARLEELDMRLGDIAAERRGVTKVFDEREAEVNLELARMHSQLAVFKFGVDAGDDVEWENIRTGATVRGRCVAFGPEASYSHKIVPQLYKFNKDGSVSASRFPFYLWRNLRLAKKGN